VSLTVNEIFYSIQGESSFMGYPCVFVRLTGCNLRCSYCDTRYAYDEGEELELQAIVDLVAVHRCPLVEVTGGEPLIQQQTPALIRRLVDDGYQVLLETNGSQNISRVDERCVRIVDIKCPSSGEAERNDLENLTRLTQRDELKFVIGNREDYEYARTTLGLVGLKRLGTNQVHFAPVFGKMQLKTLAEWVLADHLRVRLQPQLHRLIWSADQRGV
jgi:7-carboxy-7-deazaguanine synthase